MVGMRYVILFLALAFSWTGQAEEKEYTFEPLPKEELAKEKPVKIRMYFNQKVPQGMLMYMGSASWTAFAGRTIVTLEPDYGRVVLLHKYKGKPLAEGDSVDIEARIIGVYTYRERSYKVYKFVKELTEKELNN